MNIYQRRYTFPGLLLLILLSSQTVVAQIRSATVYSPLKHPHEMRDFCLDFKTGVSAKRGDPCDLRYGNLYAGEERDWLQSSLHISSRNVIKDLGPRQWDDDFDVPVVTPLPTLAPGQQRRITVDASGADGADGAPGADGEPGKPGEDGDGSVRRIPDPPPLPPTPRPTKSKPKRDGKPKVDPVFVKAVVGHLYVVRVVDDNNDFYALFRVDQLKSGDHCVVSWRIIQPPSEKPAAVQR